LIDFYSAKGLLTSVPAAGEPEQICLHTMAALEERKVNRAAHSGDASPAARGLFVV
jgi:hypothetical protein